MDTPPIFVPPPVLKRRAVNAQQEQIAISKGLYPVMARVIAARPFPNDHCPKQWLAPKLATLDHPGLLKDMERAVARVVEALRNHECIGIETDHDCDGQTSHAVLYSALLQDFNHPPHLIRSYIGHRLKEGYGLSSSVAARILADSPRPTLVITADNGSGDEARIAQLKAAAIDVIVTDHHGIPDAGIPQSAYAVLNPTREDCAYPDPYIAGCMVAWLLMAATRRALIDQQYLPPTTRSLAHLLDYVAIGTVADCVSLARSKNNRAVIRFGLNYINQGTRPCWRALHRWVNPPPYVAEDLAFRIGPLLNSDGRLANAFGSVSFLLATNDEQASEWTTYLQTQNTERKAVQNRITELSLQQASPQVLAGRSALCIFLEAGHSGVHGISASKLKELYGRPTIIFCPKPNHPGLITGSARGIDALHLAKALQEVAKRQPQLIEAFGGHQGAAGLTLKKIHFAAFSHCFEEVVQDLLNYQPLTPVIWSDGDLPHAHYSLAFVEQLMSTLEPFGREFELPTFEATVKILGVKLIGAEQIHLRLTCQLPSQTLDGIWFNFRRNRDAPMPIVANQTVKIAFSLRCNQFRGVKRLEMMIVHVWDLA